METTCAKLIGPSLIDTRIKLSVLLLFSGHLQLQASAASLGQRLPGNHWALEEALEELVAGGVLERVQAHGQWEYALAGRSDVRSELQLLARCFDDPHRREEIYRLVCAAEEERRFREAQVDRQRAIGGEDAFELVVV
ncbi:MAG TPA: hypothetical protein VNL77_01575 [Roseiflexaceae bacterium]|nr:hypothetical protein [Roseiflexaceae bacterium]